MRIPYITIVAAGALALGGCAYGDMGLGVGYGSPYYGYGYGGPYGSGYYGGLGYSPYYGAGYYGGFPYYGWYDDYYYPGTGYYVYDTYRRPHIMTSRQRVYWSKRSPALRTTSVTTRTVVRPNWSDFNHRTTTRADRQTAREQRQQAREDRRRNMSPD